MLLMSAELGGDDGIFFILIFPVRKIIPDLNLISQFLIEALLLILKEDQ